MKTRSALFLSTTLTTFVLAIITSVVSALNSAKTDQVALAATPTSTQELLVTDLPTQPVPTAAPTQVGPMQAASLAAQFLNKTDVYSVESTSMNGATAFKVVFSSGDIVYIGLNGQVIATTKLQPVTVNVASAPAPAAPANQGGGGHHNSGGQHEDDGGGD